MTKHKTGGCHCGEIRYQFSDNPLNAVFCYCKDCQKASGSDKAFSLLLKVDSLEITKGNPSIYTTIAKSNNELKRYFCPKCGSTLFGKSEALGIIGLAVGNLDNSDEYEPKMAIFTKSAPKWAVIPEDIPNFPESPQF